MKKIFDKLLVKLIYVMSRPRFEKVFMVVLPCTAVLIATLMLASPVSQFMEQMRLSYEAKLPEATAQPQEGEYRSVPVSSPDVTPTAVPTATPAPTSTPAPSPTPAVTPKPAPTAQPSTRATVKISARSVERDLYVQVLDFSGTPLYEEGIPLTVKSPSGESSEYVSDAQGSYYISQLQPGEHRLSIPESKDYVCPEAAVCSVKDKVEYTPIENISAIVTIQDVSDIYTDELTYTDTPAQLVPEVIETPEEAQGENNVILVERPVIDENGHQSYRYDFSIGPNGFLMLKGGEEESNVLPVDEDGDGVYEYGLYEESKGYYVSELLYNADNTPVAKFEAAAIALTETSETRVGWQNIDGNMYYYDTNGVPVKGLKEIDGELYYFSQFGVRASKLGIDVSYYNEDINWSAVKANGIDFAILRVGGRTWEKGLLYYDTRFKEYLSGAKAAGVPVGVYFYSTAINEVEAVQEASVTLELLGGASLDYPVYIDMEYSGMYPDARMDNLTIPERSAIANAFCKTIIDGGYSAGVYSGEYYYEQCMDHSAISQYNIWLANYTKDNKLPDYKYRYDMWQFSDSGKVAGIQGGVDMNVIF